MLTLRNTLLTGALAAGVAFGVAAQAADSNTHTMDVALPDGSVAQVTYHGDVAPRVAVMPVNDAALVDAAAGPSDFDRMFAAMERERVAMLRQMAAMQNAVLAQAVVTPSSTPASVKSGQTASLPLGTSFSYTYVSTAGGPRGCTQTVEWRSDGSAKQPQVIRTASGDCDAAGAKVAPAVAPSPASTHSVAGKTI